MAACQHIVDAAELTNLSFRVGPADDLAPDPGYDIIVSVDVLEHVPDDVGVLHRMAAALRPGGRLVLHLPLRHQLQRRILPAFRDHLIADHVRDEYTAEEISAKLAEAGFAVLSLRYGFGPWGELSFELNNLFWRHRALRNLTALLTLPIALPLGYLDVRQRLTHGNSIVLVAALKSDTEERLMPSFVRTPRAADQSVVPCNADACRVGSGQIRRTRLRRLGAARRPGYRSRLRAGVERPGQIAAGCRQRAGRQGGALRADGRAAGHGD